MCLTSRFEPTLVKHHLAVGIPKEIFHTGAVGVKSLTSTSIFWDPMLGVKLVQTSMTSTPKLEAGVNFLSA